MPRQPKDLQDDQPNAADKVKGGVQSLERAFRIIELVSTNPEGISLAEISRNVELHNSTVFNLLKTLINLGYLRRSDDGRRYQIGRMIFQLAARSVSEINLITLATPAVEKLAADTGEACHFAVLSEAEAIVLVRAVGSGTFQLVDKPGGSRPVHATALGKALLAGLPAEKLGQLLAGLSFPKLTPTTITEAERLRSQVEEARRVGFAFDDGEYNSEVRCVAAPIVDFTGKTVGAIGVSGPVWRVTLPRLQEIMAEVGKAATALSAELGGGPTPAPTPLGKPQREPAS